MNSSSRASLIDAHDSEQKYNLHLQRSSQINDYISAQTQQRRSSVVSNRSGMDTSHWSINGPDNEVPLISLLKKYQSEEGTEAERIRKGTKVINPFSVKQYLEMNPEEDIERYRSMGSAALIIDNATNSSNSFASVVSSRQSMNLAENTTPLIELLNARRASMVTSYPRNNDSKGV